MIDDSDTGAAELTLAFSLSAVDRLDDPDAVFEDAATWCQSVGIVDGDTDRIQQLVDEYDLRQDFDMHGRDKWFALEEICETSPTPRHVYVGTTDEEMRVSTLFCWEYIRVSEAAEKAGWTLSERPSEQGFLSRVLASIRTLVQ